MPPLFLRTIEETAFSTWLRDSPSVFAFWFVLSFHAIGMALLIGSSAVIDLRILGVARELPLSTLKRLYPILWGGFWMQVVTGVLLLIAYPTKSLTTVAFYVKLACIAAAMVAMVRLGRTLPTGLGELPTFVQGKRLAIWSLVLWFVALTAGRFIAYTSEYTLYPLAGF